MGCFMGGNQCDRNYLLCDEGIDVLFEAKTKWTTTCRRYLQMFFLYKKCYILIEVSMKYIPKGPMKNIEQWFRWCLGTEQAKNHNMDQWWINS